MLTLTTYPPSMFRYIAADVVTRAGISALHYEHGHPLEIIKTLQAMTADPASQAGKFPLLALFQDYEEKRGTKMGMYDVSLHLIIATLTDPNYMAADRMTSTFIPVLYPIYDGLMDAIARSGYFRQTTKDLISHSKTDRMYWGKSGLYGNEGNVFNDYIDAIEIQNLQLTIQTQTICQYY